MELIVNPLNKAISRLVKREWYNANVDMYTVANFGDDFSCLSRIEGSLFGR
jgi:hypothetical protein